MLGTDAAGFKQKLLLTTSCFVCSSICEILQTLKDWKGYKITRQIEPQSNDTVKFWEEECGRKKTIDRFCGLFDEQPYFDEMDLVLYIKSTCNIYQMLIKTLVSGI